MIRVSHLKKSFNGQLVLDDINLKINKGEIFVILGASGSGKTVLLKHLIGLIKPDTGTIEINSVDITKLNERQLLGIRKNIGYLFQEAALYDFLNVFDNVAFPLKEHTHLSKNEIAQKVRWILEMVDLIGSEYKYPSELSGGMRKRAGLARAVVMGSNMVFCDEPTSGLDPIRSKDISDLIKDISVRLGCTMVITSHDIRNAFRIADRLVLIHNGRIIVEGTKESFMKSRDPFVNKFLC